MHELDNQTACGKLQTTSCTSACGMGCAAAAVWRNIKHRYYITTAAGKVAVNWIQLCCYQRVATCTFFTNLARYKLEISLRESSLEISRELYNILVCERCPTIMLDTPAPAYTLFIIISYQTTRYSQLFTRSPRHTIHSSQVIRAHTGKLSLH